MNCRDLAAKEKRLDIFEKLKREKYDITFLQDIHWEEQKSILAGQEWEYNIIRAPNTTLSRGTAILFTNTFEFQIKEHKNDKNGNYSITEIELPNKLSLILGSIYGPNIDNQTFYEDLEEKILHFNNPLIILGGGGGGGGGGGAGTPPSILARITSTI